MEQVLLNDRESISDILHHTLTIAENYLAHQHSLPPGVFIPDLALADIPGKGMGALKTLDFFEKNYAAKISNSAGPRYFGFVTGGSTPASVAGDWLVSAYDQNACGSNDSVAPQIERQTIHFFKQMFGLTDDFFGSFVTGATMSNFVGLALGRQWVGEQYGVNASNEGLGFPIKVISANPHASVIKSLSMLGMGRNALVRIPALEDREAIDVSMLDQYLAQNTGPVIIVANAGTVNTGDFDDLLAIAALKGKYRFWLHIDAAFGGFAACSKKYEHLTAGIDEADSITIDAHKWLNVPYDAAMQFTRHKELQLKVFQNSAAYLGDPLKNPDFFHYTPENSRRWRALPSWFSLVAYGKEGHCEIVERNCLAAKYLGEKIVNEPKFTLLSPVKLNIVCFTINVEGLRPEVIQHYLAAIRDNGKVFFTPTLYKGTPAIRAAISNWQTALQDMDIAFEVLKEMFEALFVTARNEKIPIDKSF
jgi:glutamate/tyrosine decarboxylase-like PLP-dependent enzyme